MLESRIADAELDIEYFAQTVAASFPWSPRPTDTAKAQAPSNPVHVLLHGDGAIPLHRELRRLLPALRSTVLASAEEIAVLQRIHGSVSGLEYVTQDAQALPAADHAVLIQQLPQTNDESVLQIVTRLWQALPATGYLSVMDDVLAIEDIDAHDLETDLLHRVLDRGHLRTDQEIRDLLTQVGAGEPKRINIGWGVMLYSLTPAVHTQEN